MPPFFKRYTAGSARKQDAAEYLRKQDAAEYLRMKDAKSFFDIRQKTSTLIRVCYVLRRGENNQ